MNKKNCTYLGFIAGATLGLLAILFMNYQSKPTKLYLINPITPSFVVQDRKGKITPLKLEENLFYQNLNPKTLEDKNNSNNQTIKEPNSLNEPKHKKQKYHFKPEDNYAKNINNF